MKSAAASQESRHLSVVPKKELTRAQVAARLDVSVSTVRRYEGERLRPRVDEDDVRWFDEKEVAALAGALINEPRSVRRRSAESAPGARPAGEIAALVFERLEQRQSLAEIVVGVRVEPSVVRELFEQWSLGLVEAHLQGDREPRMFRESEVVHAREGELAMRLARLPPGEPTRISVARYRGEFLHGDHLYPDVVELGGFLVAGPCTIDEIVSRYGPGAYRVTASAIEPTRLRWEYIVGAVGK